MHPVSLKYAFTKLGGHAFDIVSPTLLTIIWRKKNILNIPEDNLIWVYRQFYRCWCKQLNINTNTCDKSTHILRLDIFFTSPNRPSALILFCRSKALVNKSKANWQQNTCFHLSIEWFIYVYTVVIAKLHKRLKEKSIQDDGKNTELQKIFKCFKG